MDWKDKLATWGGVAAIVGLFFNFAIGSFNSLDADVKSGMKKIDQTILLIHQESTNFHREMKEFHGRLCIIEERNKK